VFAAVAVMKESMAQKDTTPKAWVRVPIVSNPSQWRNVLVPLDKPWTSLAMNGWQLYFIRTGAGPATPTITPATVPTDAVVTLDKVLSASVTLPETGGLRQYWVPVTETYLGAQLQTAEWTVLFVRLPSP
jgi:hypothetical protein